MRASAAALASMATARESPLAFKVLAAHAVRSAVSFARATSAADGMPATVMVVAGCAIGGDAAAAGVAVATGATPVPCLSAILRASYAWTLACALACIAACCGWPSNVFTAHSARSASAFALATSASVGTAQHLTVLDRMLRWLCLRAPERPRTPTKAVAMVAMEAAEAEASKPAAYPLLLLPPRRERAGTAMPSMTGTADCTKASAIFL
mmetsp:Transcript_63841/g.177497  ORF Transcript_63841/g.177497 Transcript_63841/m.177497 type:complete len:210 (-) Transcript_63841:62-691(-)